MNEKTHGQQEKEEENRRRNLFLIFVSPLLFMCGVIFCAAQIAILAAFPHQIETGVAAWQTADYGPWPWERFGPVDARLGTLVVTEQGTAAGAFISVAMPTKTPTSGQVALVETGTSPIPAASQTTIAPSLTPLTPANTPSLTKPTDNISNPTPTESLSAPTSTITATTTETPTTLTETPTATITATALVSTPSPAPVADFTTNMTSNVAPATVTFNNLSSGIINTYSWDFGDGGTSTSASPTYIYNTPGTYTITLLVTGPGGTDQATTTIQIVASPPPPTATSSPPSADLSLGKSANNTTPTEGGTITYTLTLSNNGPATATDIVVSDPLPTGLTLTSASASQGSYSSGTWTAGTLNNGATATLDLTVTVDPGTDGTTITNTANISAAGQSDPNSANNSASVTINVQSAPPVDADLALTKVVDNTLPYEGDTIIYTITLTNNGPVNATSISVSDSLPSGISYVSHTASQGSYSGSTWTVGTLNNGATATLEITATVDLGTAGRAIVNSASISGVDQPDPNATNNSGSVTVTVQVKYLDLALTKSVSQALPCERRYITYTITITNNGPLTATGVQVADTLPASVTFNSFTASQGTYSNTTGIWNVGSLANGASATLDVVVRVNSGTATTTFTNTAGLFALNETDSNAGNNSASVDVTVQTCANLRVYKSVSNTTPAEGEKIEYLITVLNSGPNDATGIELTDVLPSGISGNVYYCSQGTFFGGLWNIGALANDASATLRLPRTVDTGTQGTTITNTAEITANDQYDPALHNNDASVSFTVEPPLSADLILNKTVDDPTPTEGDTITYQVTVSNGGPDAAFNIEILDVLPANLTYVTHSAPSSSTYNTGAGIWAIDQLPPGNSLTLQIVATVNAGTSGTTITNTASVNASDQADPDPSSDVATVDITVFDPAAAELAITKTVDNPTPNEGNTIIYTITLTNNGPANGTAILVNDTLPTGVTYVSHIASQGTYSGGTWTINTLNTGTSATLNITATVDAGTAGTTITNTASITAAGESDPVNSNNTDSVDITVPVTNIADLAVTKSVDVLYPREGETIVYTIAVTNNGLANATGITLDDMLPTGVTYISDTPSQGTYSSGVWDIGALNDGATATLSLTATVDAGTVGTTITNIASISAADQSDPDLTNNSDSADITVLSATLSADLSVSKTASNSPPICEREIVTYNITLTNNGPDNATGVQVTDLLPAEVTFDTATPSQGTYDSISGLWDVGSLANGASATLEIRVRVNSGTANLVFSNTASVTALDQTDINASNDSATADVTVQECTRLSLSKTVNNPTPAEGENIEYLVTVSNSGPNDATGIQVTDVLPAGISGGSHACSQGVYLNDVWTVGALASGDSATLRIFRTVDAGTQGSTITNTAEITAYDQIDPWVNNNDDSVSFTVQAPLDADLIISKSVNNPTPHEGNQITYRITLVNNGPDAAFNVEVTDVLPAGVTYVSHNTPAPSTYNSGSGIWGNIDQVTPGASLELQIVALVDSGTGGTTITNTADITASDQADSNTANNTASTDITVPTPAADLSVGKSVDNPTPYEGDSILYTVTVTNNGPATADAIVAEDTLPVGVTYVSHTADQGTYSSGTWNIGTLVTGASTTLQINATVDNGTAGTTVTNTASIAAASIPDPNTSNNSANADINVQVSNADLSVSKTVDETTPQEGETINFTVSVTNTGPDNATGITLDDTLPAGLSYVSHLASQGTYISGVWDIGALNNGAAATLTITAMVDAGTGATTITNTASISALDQSDPDPSDNSASVNVLPMDQLHLTSMCSPNPPVYRVWRVRNNNSYDVTFTWLVYGSGETGTEVAPAESGGVPGEVYFNTTTIPSNNTVEITVDGVQHDVKASNSTPCSSADLVVTKQVSNDMPFEAETIMYTITVSNLGPDDVTTLSINDLLPAGVTYQTSSVTQGSYDPGTGDWTLGPVVSTGSATLTIEATVDLNTGGTTITNTASITASDQFDPDTSNDSASQDIFVQLTPKADLNVTKVVDKPSPIEGETIVYTVEVSNLGPDTATTVSIDDAMPAGVTYLSHIVSQGTYDQVTDSWDIGMLNNGAVVTLNVTVEVNVGTSGSTLTNRAEIASSDQLDPNTSNNFAEVDVTVQ